VNGLYALRSKQISNHNIGDHNMANIFKPTENSAENINHFIDTIEDPDLKEVLIEQWRNIVLVGRLESASDSSQQLRSAFFEAIKAVIEKKIGGQNENQVDSH
jgi:hypothetical protein